MTKAHPIYSVHIERPDGRAGDEGVIVRDAVGATEEARQADAAAKAIERTDPTWTDVISVSVITEADAPDEELSVVYDEWMRERFGRLADEVRDAEAGGHSTLVLSSWDALVLLGIAAAWHDVAIVERAAVIHVSTAPDMEVRAELFNEGYEAAMAQHLADDPTLADDWLREQRALAWDEGRRIGDAHPWTGVNPYREQSTT